MNVMRKYKLLWKGFLSGVLLMLLFAQPITAFAEYATKTIQVTADKVKVVINGENTDIETFLYQGTTYVPLREIMNWRYLAERVTYKDGKIYIGNIYDEILTPEQAEKMVENYFELPDGAVTYMPEYDTGVEADGLYAFRLRLPMTDGSDGLYTMWVLVNDTTGIIYWANFSNGYLNLSSEV